MHNHDREYGDSKKNAVDTLKKLKKKPTYIRKSAKRCKLEPVCKHAKHHNMHHNTGGDTTRAAKLKTT